MQQHRPLFGIALMVLSSVFLAVKDGLAKTFLDQVSPLQMIWTQYVGSFLVLALFAASRHGLKVLQPEPVGGQVIRGTLSAAAVGTLYWALTYVPLADATAVFMCAPLFVALLAPLVLNEHLDIMRMAPSLLGSRASSLSSCQASATTGSATISLYCRASCLEAISWQIAASQPRKRRSSMSRTTHSWAASASLC
jgi:drug/metabolite transporter (DMT)-like permease